MNLEEERDALKRELIGTQEMLGLVLYAVGEPVVVTKDFIKQGLPDNATISIEENTEEECFVFALVAPVDE